MKTLPLLFLLLLLPGCSTPDRAARNGPFGPARLRTVKTTAYCHLEDGSQNALGQRLRSGGTIASASADWSRFPVGMKFRILGMSRIFEVDDYGSALVNHDTIDLCMPTIQEMDGWGVRSVQIEILQPGSFAKSLEILRPRAKSPFIRRMVASLETKS